MRAAIFNHRSTKKDFDLLINNIVEMGKRLAKN
jgi:hypothetical protein